MNETMFEMFARAFNGVATIGEYMVADGHLVVDVWPRATGQLPSLDVVNRAIAIGDKIEARLGITVSVRSHTVCPQRAIA